MANQEPGFRKHMPHTKTIDFDLWIDCSKAIRVQSGKFMIASESDCRSWKSDSADPDSRNFEAILDGWLDDWEGDSTNDGRSFSWTLCRLVSFPDDDCAALKAHIKGLTRKIAYSGSVEVVFHTPSTEPGDTLPGQQHGVHVQAEWMFECPFTPTDQEWNQLVMNAMVDRKKGWISPLPNNEPKPSHGMSPFRRAIRQGNTSRIVSQQQGADGVKHSLRQYSQWGCDGSA
ncbi:uncharacterized protein BO97DRAFT_473776 [Aspergillus homomorphus CBS 101889]|uniref:Uncharacterized protein n=1 Tax=Aspergillus homomorphus (strain CBS 101889) TaxID=1450537 RepID=A0A395HH79_ASPHC|nr:hypothetical protein BO97DRAFT_473776 [Aspergillus homomorphus CBS 101889]RAL07251.1 hypothetical protein BO97DRAFT_473776 [Aspergillus homomorphus CBS 101889]